MTIAQALLDAPVTSLDSEVLLAFVLKKDRAFLISHPEQKLSALQQRKFAHLISERKQGKPVAHLTQQKEFYGRSFFVDERVLIPRPETEEMVEEAMTLLKAHPELKTVMDLGTGSGCIAITVALELPDRHIIGLDISKNALQVARKNAKRLNCNNVKFMESDLLVGKGKNKNFPLVILANLPYIGTKTNHFISEETHRFEPHLATYGGSDGLELYRRAFSQIKDLKLNVAAMFMEIGFSQGEAMEKEIKKAFPNCDLEIKNDLAGLPRMAILTSERLAQKAPKM